MPFFKPLPLEAGEVQFDPDSCPWRDWVEERELWDTGFEVVRIWAAYRLPDTHRTPDGRPRWVCYAWDAFESEGPAYENPYREVSPEELRQALHRRRRPLPKELAEVGADLPEAPKAPAPPSVPPDVARNRWMIGLRLAGMGPTEIVVKLRKHIETHHLDWEPIESRQGVSQAIAKQAKEDGTELEPLRKQSAKADEACQPRRLTAS
jgi:hypothetical protein